MGSSRTVALHRRAVPLLVVTAAVAAVTALVPVNAQPEATGKGPTVGPLEAGRGSYVAGTYAWTDYAYDDRGPDTNGRPGGDATYPAEMSPNNVADLIQLQVTPSGGSTMLTVVLETLEPGTRPVVGVAFDSDGNPATGAAKLPGKWAPAASLGVDRLYVLDTDGTGTALTAAVGAAPWIETATFPVTVDVAANTLAATVPFAFPHAGAVRAVAAVGYDGEGGSWLKQGSDVHDLAFVEGEAPTMPYLESVSSAIVNFVAGGDNIWQDHRQAAILAGTADPAGAIASIDAAKLRSRVTEIRDPRGQKGFHTFLYRSDLRLGEGIREDEEGVLFAGPYQPYLVWMPDPGDWGAQPRLPLVMYLHGSSQTHLAAVNTAPYGPKENRDPIVRQPDAFYDFDAVVAWPLGRGPQQWYEAEAEQDVLDVTDDLLARLPLDPDRVMLSGLSMGGFGTFRLAQRHPDRWSMAYSDVGGISQEAYFGTDPLGLAGNLTALPVWFQNGAVDYLVHAPIALVTRASLDATNSVAYRSFLLHKRHHQPAGLLSQCVYETSFATRRVRNPARVRYTVDRSTFAVDEKTGLRLVYDGAYWVDGMTPVAGRASVDLVSWAFDTLPATRPTTREPTAENVTAGRDFCPRPTDVRTNDTWDEQVRVVAAVPNVNRRPLITGSARGLSAFTIAADRAFGRPKVTTGRVEIGVERPVTLTLTGLAPGAVVRSGTVARTADGDGIARIAITPTNRLAVVTIG